MRNLRFNFPYPPALVFAFNSSTGQYSFSSEYMKRFDDISNWGVTDEFFETYPKLRDDLSLAKELRWVGQGREEGQWKAPPQAVKTFLVTGEAAHMAPNAFCEELYF